MARIEPSHYEPDVAIPPGATILEALRENGMTQTEFAERMGRPLNKMNEVIRGKRAITPDTAHALALVLGLPAHFWMNLETNYQLTLKRLDAEVRFRKESAALKRFPLREMIKLGWVAKGKDDIETTRNLLEFFRIASFENLRKPSVLGAAFRKSQIKSACEYSLAAWLRMGEIKAGRIATGDFSGPGLVSSIAELRSLSLLPPDQFAPRLVGVCASHGVAVVLVPHLPKSFASGAAYWVGDRAVVQLSLRFGTNDHFWFSFFHELGHIVLHGKSNTFIDDFSKSDDDKELRADLFSSNCLISPSDYARLKTLDFYRADVVRGFAERIGVAPGIVVGRLQHDGLLPYSVLNGLKVKFSWDHPALST